MTLQLDSGTKIYRSLGTKEFQATYFNSEKGVMQIVVEPSLQPVKWEKQATTFFSLTQWAMSCASVVHGDGERHAVNGWKVCYIKHGDKRIYLYKLRDEPEAKPETEKTEEMPKKPLPKEPVAFEKSVLKNFPVIKKMYVESEKQPEVMETDSQKIWKETIDGKERFVCEEGFIFEVGTDGEPGNFVGTKQ
jgi:hypothetical protein